MRSLRDGEYLQMSQKSHRVPMHSFGSREKSALRILATARSATESPFFKTSEKLSSFATKARLRALGEKNWPR